MKSFSLVVVVLSSCLLGKASLCLSGEELSTAVIEPSTESESSVSDLEKPALPAKKESAAEPKIEAHVVKIKMTQRRPDFFRPWTKASPAKSSGSGVVISGNRILTNAHVVMYASQVLVQLQQGGDQLSAKVVAIAPGIDLAIVELLDPSALEDLPGLEIGDDLAEVKSRITAYGYPTGGDDLSVTDGIVSRIEFTGFYHGAMGARIQVDAALNPGNSGGPAIQEGKIAGLVFSKIQEADNIGYLIPPEEIRTFLADVEDGKYHGKPMLLDQLQTAENPAFRSFLKLEKNETGIAVKTPYHHLDDSVLQPWDVITHVGEHEIDNQGYVEVRDGLRLRFLYYVPKLAKPDPEHPDDPSRGLVPLKLLRDGEPVEVEVPVQADRDLVVPLLKENYPDYFIYGPMVFTAATQEYVRAI
ncbi:MAG: serine protease, partial [Lacipirellulaceae bacterium]